MSNSWFGCWLTFSSPPFKTEIPTQNTFFNNMHSIPKQTSKFPNLKKTKTSPQLFFWKLRAQASQRHGRIDRWPPTTNAVVDPSLLILLGSIRRRTHRSSRRFSRNHRGAPSSYQAPGGMWPNELEVGPNKGVERRKQGARHSKQTSIWQLANMRCLEVKTWNVHQLRKGRAPWMEMLLTLKWPSRHHLAGRQMAVSFLDPVETLPHLHQSRHPHPIVPMESQQCRPCRWTTRVPTQPASRSLPGCLAVFCYYSSLRSSAISNELQI